MTMNHNSPHQVKWSSYPVEWWTRTCEDDASGWQMPAYGLVMFADKHATFSYWAASAQLSNVACCCII